MENMRDGGKIALILKKAKTIAIVGLSENEERDSHMVAKALLAAGYAIVPVNPAYAEWRGIKAFPSLLDIPQEVQVDIVDVFRKSETVPQIAAEALARFSPPKVFWMQLGVENKEAAGMLEAKGWIVVQNRCIKLEHSKMIGKNWI